MLQDMRRSSNSWLIYLLFGIIILVFVFMFGLPSTDNISGTNDPVVASVGDHEIKASELKSFTYRIYGDNLRSENFKAAQYDVLQKLSLVYLLSDRAENMGMRVSDEELQDYITNWQSHNPDAFSFLKKNHFSKQNYEQAVARNGFSVKAHEAYKKRELLARKYLAVLENSIYVPDSEIERLYKETMTTIELSYLQLTPNTFEKLIDPVTEQEVLQFLNSSFDKIENYYKNNNSQFVTPEKVQLQEVVIQKRYEMLREVGEKTDKGLSAAERFNIAKIQILEKGLNFEQAVKDYDESILKRPNGIGNMLNVNDIQQEYQNALAGKNIGEIVIIETKDTSVIAKIVARAERIETPLDDVKNDIAKKLITQTRLEEALEKTSKQVLAEIQNGKSLDDVLNNVVYAGVLEEPPAPTPEPVAQTENNENSDTQTQDQNNTDDTNLPTNDNNTNPTEPTQIALDNAFYIPLVERINVESTGSFSISSTNIPRLGEYPNIVRTAIHAKAGFTIPQTFNVDNTKVFVNVKAITPPTDEEFKAELEELRTKFRQDRIANFIGQKSDPFTFSIIRLQGEPGIWLKSMRDYAIIKGELRENKDYFAIEHKEQQAIN